MLNTGQTFRDKVGKNLTPEQRTEIEKRARDWVPPTTRSAEKLTKFVFGDSRKRVENIAGNATLHVAENVAMERWLLGASCLLGANNIG
ncbi:MAG: hypothetical protein ABR557_14260, partial [Pyrinomonadaceae bacterium]